MNHQPSTMNVDTDTVDRIVAGVLNQLASVAGCSRSEFTAEMQKSGGIAERVTITASVVTAEALLDCVNGKSLIVVSEKAIVTPAAWDEAKERGVEIIRSAGVTDPSARAATTQKTSPPMGAPLLIVVRTTDTLERLWNDMNHIWRRELLSCPDDAAALATSAVCRGEGSMVAILAEQVHRAACLANRNERVNAVAVRDAGEIKSAKQQLRANVWCLDPTGCSWIELRNLLRAIADN